MQSGTSEKIWKIRPKDLLFRSKGVFLDLWDSDSSMINRGRIWLNNQARTEKDGGPAA